MQQWDQVTKAASAFEARWTFLSIKRVDPDLYQALREQSETYHQACMLGTEQDAQQQAEGLVRGYAAAIRAMENSGIEDTAYLVGRYAGMTVVISEQKAAQERVRELTDSGERAVLLSPDEVAAMFAACESLKRIAAIKQLFPGAELIERYPDEPAKGDG